MEINNNDDDGGASTQPVDRVEFEFPVVGTAYTAFDVVNTALQPGTPVELRPEPDNEYDQYAVAVYWCGDKLGYVPNKGYSCPRCFTPVAHTGNYEPLCDVCGVRGVAGGMSYRLSGRQIFPDKYVAYVTELFTDNPRVPIRLKVMLDDKNTASLFGSALGK